MSVEGALRANTTTLLLEFSFRQAAEQELTPALLSLMKELSLNGAALSAWRVQSFPVLTCYIDADLSAGLLEKIRDIATTQLGPVIAGEIELSRLQRVAVHQGASHHEKASFHYVVRTDVEQGGDEELQRWYAEEHMAMLAAVPGTVQARRFISLDATPRYYACYDLLAPEVLTSAHWLTARATPWSERVRPTFRNTRRVISSKVEFGPLSSTLLAVAENPARYD